MKKRGFTLIELLVVIAIIAIETVILWPVACVPVDGAGLAPANVPMTMVVGDGSVSYTDISAFAAYMAAAGAPAYAGSSRRGAQVAPEGEMLARLTFGRQTNSRTRGDAEVKVGDYRIERDSDSVTSRSVSVSLSGFGRTWATTEVARESDSSWRVRGDDVEVERPNRRSTGSALDSVLRKLARDAAEVVKTAGLRIAPAPQPFGTGGAAQSADELAPLFQAETASPPTPFQLPTGSGKVAAGTRFVLVSADPQHRPAPVVISYDSRQLSTNSLLTVYDARGQKKCSISVRWNTRYRAWTIERVFSAQGGGMPELGDRAEHQ